MKSSYQQEVEDRQREKRRAITLQLLEALATAQIEVKEAFLIGPVLSSAPEDRGCFLVPVKDGVSPIHVNVVASESSQVAKVVFGLTTYPKVVLNERRDGTVDVARFVGVIRQMTDLSREEFRKQAEQDALETKLKQQRERILAHRPTSMSRSCLKVDVECLHVGLASVTFPNLREAEAIKLLQAVANMRLYDSEE